MSDDISEKLAAVRDKLNDLQRDLTLDDQRRAFDKLNDDIRLAVEKLSALRQKGYQFGASWQQALEQEIPLRWRNMEREVRDLLRDERNRLESEFRQAEWRLGNATKRNDFTGLQEAERETEDVERKLQEAAERIEAYYKPLQQQLDEIERRLRELDWTFDHRDEASFEFLDHEALILAVKAEWVQTGKGGQDPDGILFLTDQRLIFEQKETKGKVLGLFGGRKEQNVELIIEVGKITEITSEDKGMFGGKDMLHFKVPAGPYYDVTLELKGGADNDYWAQLIQRAADGSVASDRIG